ncbi:MAG: GtrA family protein [Ruminococcaceae bacterium]|nr:GtrA family protein [Oscillospiraceae bacterium]
MKKIKRESVGEFIRYLIIGFSNTAINWVVFTLLNEFTPLGDFKTGATISSAVAWIISTIFFAFWAYKLFVFKSKSMLPGILWMEFVAFTSARLLTFGVEQLIIFIGCTLMGFDNDINILLSRIVNSETKVFVDFTLGERYFVKLAATGVITILNYIFSKLVIFKKGQRLSSSEDHRDEGEKA